MVIRIRGRCKDGEKEMVDADVRAAGLPRSDVVVRVKAVSVYKVGGGRSIFW